MLYYPPPERTTDVNMVREPRKPGRPRKSDGNDSDMQMRMSQVCLPVSLLHGCFLFDALTALRRLFAAIAVVFPC